MKKGVIAAIIAAAAVIIGALAAYNHFNSTPPGVAGKTVSKMQKLNSVTGELIADYDGTISYMGIGVDIGVDADLEVQILTGEHMRSHETGTVTIEALGFSYPVALENYALQEEDGFTSYINLQKGKWLRHHGTGTESEKTESFDSTKFVLGMIQKIMRGEIKAETSKETEMLGDREVRRMDVHFSGPALQNLVTSASEYGEFERPEDLDLTEASADITVFVDKKTGDPAEFRFDCTALGNVMMKRMTGNQDWDGEAKSFTLTFRFNEFDTLESLEVPAHITENAIDVENLNILDGILN